MRCFVIFLFFILLTACVKKVKTTTNYPDIFFIESWCAVAEGKNFKALFCSSKNKCLKARELTIRWGSLHKVEKVSKCKKIGVINTTLTTMDDSL